MPLHRLPVLRNSGNTVSRRGLLMHPAALPVCFHLKFVSADLGSLQADETAPELFELFESCPFRRMAFDEPRAFLAPSLIELVE